LVRGKFGKNSTLKTTAKPVSVPMNLNVLLK